MAVDTESRPDRHAPSKTSLCWQAQWPTISATTFQLTMISLYLPTRCTMQERGSGSLCSYTTRPRRKTLCYLRSPLAELSFAADRRGHFYGTNVAAVQLARAQGVYGSRQSYEQDKDSHTQVEAGFDLLSVESHCKPEMIAKIASDIRYNKLDLEILSKSLTLLFGALYEPHI